MKSLKFLLAILSSSLLVSCFTPRYQISADDNYLAFNMGGNMDLQTGERVWERNEIKGLTASSDFSTNTYIAKTGNTIFAFDTINKVLNWKTDVVNGQYPILSNDPVIFVGFNKTFAIDKKTGKILWTIKKGSNYLVAPIIDQNKLFLYSGRSLFSIDIEKGKIIWEYRIGNIYGDLSVSDENIYFAKGKKLFILNKNTKEQIKTINTNKKIIAGPLVSKEYIIYGHSDNTIHAMDKFSGKEVYIFSLKNKLVNNLKAFDDLLYIGCRGGIYAIDIDTGIEKWFFDAKDETKFQSIEVHKDRVFYSTSKWKAIIYILNAKTGEIIKSIPPTE